MDVFGWILWAAALIFTIVNRKSKALKAASVPQLFGMLIGMAFCLTSSTLVSINKPTPVYCGSIVWTLGIGFSLTFGYYFPPVSPILLV
jgi:CO dehydrogenase/acetyl-CoA synthase beta subunit